MKLTSQEIGESLRPGLANLKKYFSGDDVGPKGEERVDRLLKGVRTGAHLAAQENNELLMVLKYGKASGATPVEMRPIFQTIASRYSSVEAPPETREPLAIEESTGSAEKKG